MDLGHGYGYNFYEKLQPRYTHTNRQGLPDDEVLRLVCCFQKTWHFVLSQWAVNILAILTCFTTAGNRIGSNTLPWGTPLKTGMSLVRNPLILNLKVFNILICNLLPLNVVTYNVIFECGNYFRIKIILQYLY